MSTDRGRVLSKTLKDGVLPIALLTVVMIGLGFLITRLLVHVFPFTVEDKMVGSLVAARTPTWNTASDLVSQLAYTPAIVVVMAVTGGAMRFFYHRWREFLFLLAALVAQLVVFELTSVVVARERPAVPQLDVFPPMRSFPSGHAAAAVALYGGIAVVLALHSRRGARAALVWAIAVTIALAVAISRMYRGMHHPSDVVASFLLGFACLWILRRALLSGGEQGGRATL